jgi:hypothetical protein
LVDIHGTNNVNCFNQWQFNYAKSFIKSTTKKKKKRKKKRNEIFDNFKPVQHMTNNQNTITATSDDMYSNMDGYASQEMIPDITYDHAYNSRFFWCGTNIWPYWWRYVTLPRSCFWRSAILLVAWNSSLMHLWLWWHCHATYIIFVMN